MSMEEKAHSFSRYLSDYFLGAVRGLIKKPISAPERTDAPEPETALEMLEASVPKVLDLRGRPRTKRRGESKGYRRWEKVNAITWHQSAVWFENPEAALNWPVHGVVMPDGTVVLLHDPTAYLHQAHALNRDSIGIEIVCMAAGIEGNDGTRNVPKKINPKTQKKWTREDWLKKKPTRECTEIQIQCGKALARYYDRLFTENEGSIAYQHTHRQGHKSRIADPGSRIFQMIVEPSAAELNHTIRYSWARGSGNKIPAFWSEKGKADYSWRFKQP